MTEDAKWGICAFFALIFMVVFIVTKEDVAANGTLIFCAASILSIKTKPLQ